MKRSLEIKGAFLLLEIPEGAHISSHLISPPLHATKHSTAKIHRAAFVLIGHARQAPFTDSTSFQGDFSQNTRQTIFQ
ncbi:hypothetical protein [Collimonas sp.]|jgi:hypothetical protein|uniref:hypothetical protein n=1 Tax=Collimonas sp. TaxID=1963772 RepID=UPI002B86E070|nr:hypothetical protein [Collimonas sp.]HWW07026.1 hypothetical protein [Collimonas sp.]